jgi:1,4-dihydroxy-2-naphthoyl-CoA synthase
LLELRLGSLASATKKGQAVQFWSTDRRGAVEIATFSNPPHNYLHKPVIDELEQLVVQWRDPSIRAVVIQSRAEDAGFFTQYSVEELYGLASDPATSRFAGALVRGYKAIFDQMTARPKVIIAAMNGDAMGGGFELTLACDLRIGQHGDFRYGNPEVRAGAPDPPASGRRGKVRCQQALSTQITPPQQTHRLPKASRLQPGGQRCRPVALSAIHGPPGPLHR